MDPTNKVGRREFTVASALALLNGVAITVTACSSSSDSPTAPTVTPGGGSSGSISLNHGHTAVITGAELTAANDIELDISGTADHPHSVSLTGGELQQIAGGTRVSTESTTMTTTRSWLGSGRGCVCVRPCICSGSTCRGSPVSTRERITCRSASRNELAGTRFS